MALVTGLLNALAALPAIAGYVERFCSAVVAWWVARQKAEVLASIADAAAFAARANTQEERYAAAAKWQVALSKPRAL